MVDKQGDLHENEGVLQDPPKKKKILIVEDEEVLADMYQEVFGKEGFEVVKATTGQQALEAASSQKPDFILLDILLPGDNGMYFLTQCKKIPKLANIPVVAFSNFDDPNIKKNALRLGAEDYLIKTSYTPQEVVKKVMQYTNL